MPIPRGCLCLVTDRRAVSPDARTTAEEIAGLERQLDLAIESQIDLIQIRERDLEAKSLQQLVMRVANRATGSPTQVVVNDRADVALSVPDIGLHLRSDGPSPARVRGLLGPERLLGQSVHALLDGRSRRASARRVSGGLKAADYVIFGSVFASVSKPDQASIAGLEGLRQAVQAGSCPVLAIGGITPERAAVCADAGAAGVAAIGPFLPAGSRPDALGPREAIAAFRHALRRAS